MLHISFSPKISDLSVFIYLNILPVETEIIKAQADNHLVLLRLNHSSPQITMSISDAVTF